MMLGTMMHFVFLKPANDQNLEL